MNTLKKIFSMLVFLFISVLAFAKDGDQVQMADTMRSNGRIYVVIAVMLTILIGLILYVIRLDRKITRLEKDSH